MTGRETKRRTKSYGGALAGCGSRSSACCHGSAATRRCPRTTPASTVFHAAPRASCAATSAACRRVKAKAYARRDAECREGVCQPLSGEPRRANYPDARALRGRSWRSRDASSSPTCPKASSSTQRADHQSALPCARAPARSRCATAPSAAAKPPTTSPPSTARTSPPRASNGAPATAAVRRAPRNGARDYEWQTSGFPEGVHQDGATLAGVVETPGTYPVSVQLVEGDFIRADGTLELVVTACSSPSAEPDGGDKGALPRPPTNQNHRPRRDLRGTRATSSAPLEASGGAGSYQWSLGGAPE